MKSGSSAITRSSGGALARTGGSGLGRALGGIGLLASGAATAKDLTDSLKRGEGYAKLFKKGTTHW